MHQKIIKKITHINNNKKLNKKLKRFTLFKKLKL